MKDFTIEEKKRIAKNFLNEAAAALGDELPSLAHEKLDLAAIFDPDIANTFFFKLLRRAADEDITAKVKPEPEFADDGYGNLIPVPKKQRK